MNTHNCGLRVSKTTETRAIAFESNAHDKRETFYDYTGRTWRRKRRWFQSSSGVVLSVNRDRRVLKTTTAKPFVGLMVERHRFSMFFFLISRSPCISRQYRVARFWPTKRIRRANAGPKRMYGWGQALKGQSQVKRSLVTFAPAGTTNGRIFYFTVIRVASVLCTVGHRSRSSLASGVSCV